MIASEKAYAKALLTRVNPYTGLAYTDDPCVAVIEINNENAFFNNFYHGGGMIDKLPEPYASEFRKQWNAWLGKKYASTDALQQAWKGPDSPDGFNVVGRVEDGTVPIIKTADLAPMQAHRDFYQFAGRRVQQIRHAGGVVRRVV